MDKFERPFVSAPPPSRSARSTDLVPNTTQVSGALLTRDLRSHEHSAAAPILGNASSQEPTSHPRIVW